MERRTVLYGLGSWINSHYMWIKRNYQIVGGYDRDTEKRSMAEALQIPFLSLDELKGQDYDQILITSTFESEIRRYLLEELKIDKEILSGNGLYEEWERTYCSGEIVSLGEKYPDNTFVIVQRGSAICGLAAYFNTFVREVKVALENGMIPLIDMKNYWSAYHNQLSDATKINVWDYYFEQPVKEYDVDDAWQAKYVKFSDRGDCKRDREFVERIIRDLEYRMQLHQVYEQYMPPTKQIQDMFQEAKAWYSEHVTEDDKVLGITVRGTDYRDGKPYMHAIQPSLEQFAEKIQEALDTWGCTKIYVTSDEKNSIDYLEKRFPKRVFYRQRELYDSYTMEKNLTVLNVEFEHDDALRRGAEYLISLMLLKQCDCFMGGMNGGTALTLIQKNTFEREYIFDIGVYGIDEDAYLFTPDGKPIYVNKKGF